MLAGALQDRSIPVGPLAVAVKFVGAPGSSAVAVATLEAGPVPAELMADTR